MSPGKGERWRSGKLKGKGAFSKFPYQQGPYLSGAISGPPISARSKEGTGSSSSYEGSCWYHKSLACFNDQGCPCYRRAFILGSLKIVVFLYPAL